MDAGQRCRKTAQRRRRCMADGDAPCKGGGGAGRTDDATVDGVQTYTYKARATGHRGPREAPVLTVGFSRRGRR